MIGARFGRWTVIDTLQTSKWLCRCDCGTERMVAKRDLKRGHSSSCGCLKREMAPFFHRKHGHGRPKAQTPTYKSWSEMIARCSNPKSKIYRYYGGRGIAVCERWRSFENFLADMGERPPERSLDRIDTNGNYEPKNCRWATKVQQMRNMRSNHLIEYHGEMLPLIVVAERVGINSSTLATRLDRGMPLEKALKPIDLRSERFKKSAA